MLYRQITQAIRETVLPEPAHCPHCLARGARAYQATDGRWQLRCICGASGPAKTSAAAALDAWNTRVEVAGPSLVRWAGGVER